MPSTELFLQSLLHSILISRKRIDLGVIRDFHEYLYLEISHQSFIARQLSSCFRFPDILKEKSSKFGTVYILSEVDIYRTQSLFLETKTKKYRFSVVIDDGEFFNGRIIVESSIDIDTIFIYRYHCRFWSIILHHKIYSSKYKNHDT